MVERDGREQIGRDGWLQEHWEQQLQSHHCKQLHADAEGVSERLGDGQLSALADFLESEAVEMPGLPEDLIALPRWLAHEIIAMIAGQHWFRLDTTSLKRGRTQSQFVRDERRRLAIGHFVQMRLHEFGPGSYEAVIREAEERFSQSRTYVKAAHRAARRYVEDWARAGGKSDGWQLLRMRVGEI